MKERVLPERRVGEELVDKLERSGEVVSQSWLDKAEDRTALRIWMPAGMIYDNRSLTKLMSEVVRE
jgi:hypothetical protein